MLEIYGIQPWQMGRYTVGQIIDLETHLERKAEALGA